MGHTQRGRCAMQRRHDMELEELKNVHFLHTEHSSTVAEQVQEEFVSYQLLYSFDSCMVITAALGRPKHLSHANVSPNEKA